MLRVAGLLIVLATATAAGIIASRIGDGRGTTNPRHQLLALSRESLRMTYTVAYGTQSGDAFLTIRRSPHVGIRVDFTDPIADEAEDSGDILIFQFAEQQHPYISCNSRLKTCRTMDGLERLVLASFGAMFVYSSAIPFFEQPHVVAYAADIELSGEKGACFRIDQDTTKTPTRGTGFVPGVGWPVTFCYSDDGIPLFVSGYGISAGGGLSALRVERKVDDAVFEPPYTVLASEYDR